MIIADRHSHLALGKEEVTEMHQYLQSRKQVNLSKIIAMYTDNKKIIFFYFTKVEFHVNFFFLKELTWFLLMCMSLMTKRNMNQY